MAVWAMPLPVWYAYGSAVGAGGGNINYLSKFKHAHMLLLLKETVRDAYCTAENRVRYGLTL